MTTVPSTVDVDSAYQKLLTHAREAQLLGGTEGILGWDQETMMPPRGVEYRSRQLALLARLRHRMHVDERIPGWLDEAESDASLSSDPLSVERVNLRELRRDYERATKLPESLVEELARLGSTAQHEWAEARRDSDFKRFQPWLERIVELTRRKAECFGWAEGGEPWDALAEDYEPGCTAASVAEVFTPLRERLTALVDELLGSSTQPSDAFNRVALPIDRQEAFVREISESVGFDYQRGRLDRSTHPFCGGACRNDVRLTTRFRDDEFNDALGSTLHETGHGIYEQGLLEEHIGTPMGDSVSLGIHESQSRMWENQVGRSEAFWRWCGPKMKAFFGEPLASFGHDDFYGGANIVKRGLIRVESDEATYNLHVMVRFELERRLMTGDLAVADLPDAWNAMYRDVCGVEVPDDRRGCLQDVHWSFGAIGYFPTYTLGNLYCAQFFEAAQRAIPGLVDGFAEGRFEPLRLWLNENIHAHGRRYRAADLCRHVTGEPLSAEPLLRHLESKLRPLYGI